MAIWTMTKGEIDQGIRSSYMEATSSGTITYLQSLMISDGINSALQQICMDFGYSRFSFLNSDITISTIENQGHVDLTQMISSIISGTMRIPSEGSTLLPMSLAYIQSVDPDADQTGVPEMYGFDSASDADMFRLQFWPIPDAVYSIRFTARKIVDQDATTDIPSYLMAALKDLSRANAFRDLRLYQEASVFENSYRERKKEIKNALDDGPIHIPRRKSSSRTNLQQRVN